MEGFDFIRELLALRKDLFGFACKLTADKDEAEDLLQETLLKALENKEKFAEGTNLGGWVYIIMRNIFINGYLAEKRHPNLYTLSDSTYQTDMRDYADFIWKDSSLETREILDMLKLLPEKNYRAFQMYMSGFKYQEIADRMGEPLGTVKSRIFHSRKKLKRLLNDFMD